MNERFRKLVGDLESKCQTLLSMVLVTAERVPNDTPVGGVYLFSEGLSHLYVGRTKRRIALRIRNHFSTARDCSFAWLLAREETGIRAAYRPEGSRKSLLADTAFQAAYERAKNRIRGMDVRYVHEPDPVKQALLEIYVAVASKAKYNNFDVH
jgi:hypothetical protein